MAAIRLRTVPMFGTGVVSKSFVSTRQRRLNVYFEIREDKDKSRFAVFNNPGLVLLGNISSNPTFTVRAMLGSDDAMYAVVASNLYRITSVSPLTLTNPPTGLTTRAGYCSLAGNATQMLVADGSAGYLYNIGNNTLTLIGQSFPNTAKTITYVSGFFVAEQPGTQKFWVSDFNDGSSWDGLAFASASSYPGNIVAVDNLQGNLILFCTDHIEFWQNVGAAPEPFQPIVSAARQYGLAALWSRAHVAETMCFLGQNTEGQFQVLQVSGYSLSVISTPDIDFLINSFPDAAQAVALSYGTDSHKFYQITFPTTNRTFVFDNATQIWSEAQTGVSVVPVRHIGDLSTVFHGDIIVSDYSNSNLYTFDPSVYTDNGVPNARELITRHTLSNFNRVRISQLYLDMETGVGLPQPPIQTISGQPLPTVTHGTDPHVMISYSKDNGRTWASERWARLGKLGEYMTRVVLRRFGSTRDAVFKIRMTDPVKFVLTDAAMTIKERGKAANRAQAQGRME
jgi:hypothetical protein